MLKKIYKNKGILFITDNNDNITFNHILINEYINHKDKNIQEIINISKKIYYEKYKCKY